MRSLLLLFLLMATANARLLAQDSLGRQRSPDSASLTFLDRIRNLAAGDESKSKRLYRESSASIRQQKLVNETRKTAQQARIFFKKGPDTLQIRREMGRIDSALAIVREGVTVNKGTAYTQRNLTISAAIVSQLLVETLEHKTEIDRFTATLVVYRNRIDSLSSDPLLYAFPSDSARAVRYIRSLAVAAKDIQPVDSALNVLLAGMQSLQSVVDLQVFTLRELHEIIDNDRQKLAAGRFLPEFPELWKPALRHRPLNEIIAFSAKKELLALKMYIRENTGRILLLLPLMLLCIFFIRSLKQRLIAEEQLPAEEEQRLLVRSPFLSASLLVLSLWQFIFIDPPFVFHLLIWLLSAAALTLIFRRIISPYWMRFWFAGLGLFLLSGIDNLVLQASRSERWLMLGIAVLGVLFGLNYLRSRKKYELKEDYILYPIGIMTLMEACSVLLNLWGRYNLSKTLMVAGMVGLIVAILFIWVVRLINEGLGLAYAVYQRPERKFFYINFYRVGNRAPLLLYLLLGLGWLVLVGHNFYEFKQVARPLKEFLSEGRNLGDYRFTINGLFLFLVISICSMLFSKLLSFFMDDPGDTHTRHQEKKRGAGSWLLLLRIIVISLGLLLAFAAAGIPLDKITFLLGALGVGIGLGLQGLVQNLVSGLIIAFERPVNVGDSIEINGIAGTMKSIGFRSSVVRLENGAFMIIPNGDLLNQHLVNRSMSKNLRKTTVPVSVAYGSDLAKVKKLLLDILLKDERVLESPQPAVMAREFGSSAIEFVMIYWMHSTLEEGPSAVSSDLIVETDRLFRKEGIEIPYPQQDLHIRSLPENAKPVKPRKT